MAIGAQDTIYIAQGRYSRSSNGESFPIIMKGGVHLIGSGPGEAVIDNERMDSTRVIESANQSDWSIQNVTITGGRMNGLRFPNQDNGGIMIVGGSNIKFLRNVVSGNSALYVGGMLIRQSQNVTMEGNLFIENRAVSTNPLSSPYVAALECLCSGSIKRNVFRDNYSDGSYPGLHAVTLDGLLRIEDNLFEGNQSDEQAGAPAGIFARSPGKIYFKGNVIRNNVAADYTTAGLEAGTGAIGDTSVIIQNNIIITNQFNHAVDILVGNSPIFRRNVFISRGDNAVQVIADIFRLAQPIFENNVIITKRNVYGIWSNASAEPVIGNIQGKGNDFITEDRFRRGVALYRRVDIPNDVLRDTISARYNFFGVGKFSDDKFQPLKQFHSKPHSSVPQAMENPFIYYIKDVPDDEGGWVTLKWSSPNIYGGVLDENGLRWRVTEFIVWESIGEFISALDVLSDSDLRITQALTKIKLDYTFERSEWIQSEIVQLTDIDSFSTAVVSTKEDSGSTGKHPVTLIVTALTENPLVFSHSLPLSGWSVNNKTVGVVDIEGIIKEFRFYPAYPNPFNSSVTLLFDIPQLSHSTLYIYNLNGRLVNRLFDDLLSQGRTKITWDGMADSGTPATSGIYFAVLSSGQFRSVKKLVLLK